MGGLSFLFGLRVTQNAARIDVRGASINFMERDIAKIWSTSRISEHMFTSISRSGFTAPLFFAIEIDYVLKAIAESSKSYSSTTAIEKLRTEMHKNTWLRNLTSDVPDILDFTQLSQLKWLPKEHQANFFREYNHIVPRYGLRGMPLGADPGTGKTYMSLAIGVMLHADITYIVCPKNALFDPWRETLMNLFVDPNSVRVWFMVDGPVPAGFNPTHVVGHYEALQQLINYAKTSTAQRPYVILDESHNLNELTALRTLLWLELCRVSRARHIIPMSGTLFKGRALEAIPILRAIDPLFTPETEERFVAIFGKDTKRGLDILAHRMGRIVHKIPKKEAVDNEPIVSMQRVKIPNPQRYLVTTLQDGMRAYTLERTRIHKENMRETLRLFEDGLAMHKRSLRTPVEKRDYDTYLAHLAVIRRGYDPQLHKKQSLYCNTYETKRIAPSLPPAMRKAWLETRSAVKYLNLKVMGEALAWLTQKRNECSREIALYADFAGIVDNAEKKTIIFASSVEAIEAGAERMRQDGYVVPMVYGKTNNELATILVDFKKKEELNPLFATYKSLSTAVPMTMANTLILIDKPFRDYIWRQAVARVSRMGQDTQTYVVELALDTGTEKNITDRTNDIMMWSRDVVAAIMGDGNPESVGTTMDAMASDTRNAGNLLQRFLSILQ